MMPDILQSLTALAAVVALMLLCSHAVRRWLPGAAGALKGTGGTQKAASSTLLPLDAATSLRIVRYVDREYIVLQAARQPALLLECRPAAAEKAAVVLKDVRVV